MTNMLFHAKISEIYRYIEYIRGVCISRQSSAYPNLARRLEYILDVIELLSKKAKDLNKTITRYQASKASNIDIWPQIFKDISQLSSAVHTIRILEIPAYLSESQHDASLSSAIEQLHREIGLDNIYPVVSTQQSQWFAVRPNYPQYPLYLIPSSVLHYPSELSLLFHEVGHVLYRLWDSDFTDHLDYSFNNVVSQKRQKVNQHSDPNTQEDFRQSLASWETLAYADLEETVCDIIGAVIGGPAFVVSLVIGLMSINTMPFERTSIGYPPLDSRVRSAILVLRHYESSAEVINIIESAWKKIQELNAHRSPRWYNILDDDNYLLEIIKSVIEFLDKKQISNYMSGTVGIRHKLNQGIITLLQEDMTMMLHHAPDYTKWAKDFSQDILQTVSSVSKG